MPQQQYMKHHAPVTRPVLHSLVQGAISVAAPARSPQQRARHGGPQRAPSRHGRHTPMLRRVLHRLAYPPSGSDSPPSWTFCVITRKTQTVVPVLHSPAASKQGQRRVLVLRCPDAWRATPVLHSLAHRRSSSGLQPSPQGSAACREMSTPIPVLHNLVQQQQQQQQQQQYHHLHLQHEPNTFNAASFSMARAPMILQSYDEPWAKRRKSSDD